MPSGTPVEARLLRPIVFARPIRLAWPCSWAGHLPFAFWVVDALRPRTLVELGTHTGVSYSAFAQAVQALDLGTACYAVDTWTGDDQAGFYGEEVYREWAAFHDRHFGGFSRLVRSTFDDARQHFAEGSIDLLHIDGLHTYDAVRHDFETWLPMLSPRAAVLFHDVNVRELDFGVWRYWDEIRGAFPSFTFVHGHGLGVLAVGASPPPELAWLTGLAPEGPEAAEVRRVFSTLGELWTTQSWLARDRAALSESETERTRLHAASEQTAVLHAEDAAAKAERAAHDVDRLRHAMVAADIESRRQADQTVLTVLQAAASRTAHGTAAATDPVRQRLRWSGVNAARLRRHPIESARALTGLAHPAFRRNIGLLGASGLFDEAFYAQHQAVRGLPVVRLREHFVRHGDRAGLSPHPLFDAGWYRRQNPDLPGDARLLFHYLRFGAGEHRSPHPLFDSVLYASRAGELQPGVSALAHFVRVGAAHGLSPHVLFDPAHYLRQNPSVAAAGCNPLLHYLETAHTELRDPHPLFATRYYLSNNPDVGQMNPLVHFVVHGAEEGRNPHPLFDVRHYLQQRPDVRHSGMSALAHYLHVAHAEDVDPHPLFDTSCYAEQLERAGVSGVNPLVHFVTGGWRLGLKPNRWFDPLWYAERWNIGGGINPLVHYANYGWREGCDPSPEFSVAGYLARHAGVAAAGLDPLAHHLQSCSREAPPAAGDAGVGSARRTFTVEGATRAPQTVLVATHVVPSAVSAGNEYRLRRMLEHLAASGYRIILVLAPLRGHPVEAETIAQLASAFGNVVVCEQSGHVRFSLRDCPDVISRLSGLLVPAAPIEDAGTPFAAMERTFCHDTAFAVVTAIAETLGRSAAIAEYIFMTRFLPSLGPQILKIVDTHDVFSHKAANVLAYGIADIDMSESEEAQRLARADVVVAINDPDAACLQRLRPDREVLVASVDADVQTSRPWPSEPVALIVGSGNALNLSGIRDFLRFVWPAVRAGLPAARLRVAGSIGTAVPPGTPGVDVLGRVPDLAVEYGRARVAINPTVAGTGLKIKTVEALAHLTPMVGWPHSRAGLPASLAGFVQEAADWHDFAEAVVRALTHERCPFDAEAISVIQEELGAGRVYRALDERLKRHFSGVDGRP